MKIVVIGTFPESTQIHIRQSFPSDWRICIVAPAAADAVLSDADVVIPEHISVDRLFLEKAPRLKLVQTGSGYDNVDVEACTKRNIYVCNAAGINATAVAEHVMALILCWYKNIAYLDSFMKSRGKESELNYSGGELAGKTIGIIGLGNVGRTLANYCKAFGMTVLGYSHKPLDVPGVEQVELDQLYTLSDIVSVHVPLLPSTRHMIDSETFSRMKPSAILVNTARGAIVNEVDLVEALRKQEIAGACLDVYEQEPISENSPLRALPNVILTPHTAGLPDSVRFHQKRFDFFRENIIKVMNKEKPDSALNEL